MRAALLLAVAIAATAPTAQAADPVRGRQLYEACQACHSLDGESGVGPSLKGVFGRRAGAVAGFRYSPAMRRSDVTWDAATIDRFLADPQAMIRGNRMPFDSVAAATDRADIVAYLEGAAQ